MGSRFLRSRIQGPSPFSRCSHQGKAGLRWTDIFPGPLRPSAERAFAWPEIFVGNMKENL